MLTLEQNAIVYLMFLNGILFLGLRFIAFAIVNHESKGSKRIGYALLTTVLLITSIQQEFQVMTQLNFNDGDIMKILLLGSVTPIFLSSIAYYRIKRFKIESKATQIKTPKK